MQLPPPDISDLIMPIRFRSLELLTVAIVLVGRVYSQTDQNQLPALMAEAKRAQTAGDVDSAIAAYARILRIRPNWGPAEFNLGLMYHLQKKYEQAVPLFIRAVQHDTALVPAWLFRGIGEYNLGRYHSAVDSLKRFLRARPDDQQVRFFLGGAYFALGDYAEAVRQYTEQLKITASRSDVYYQLGECYIALAREQTDKMVETPAGKYFSSLIHAEALAEKENFGEAEQYIREAMRLRPEAPEAFVSLGRLFLKQGNAGVAKSNFEEALKKRPSDCEARAGLAEVERKPAAPCRANAESAKKPAIEPSTAYTAIRAYVAKAQAIFAEVAKLSPESGLVARMQAQTAELQMDFAKAEAGYQQAITLDPQDPDSYLEYGRFKARLNQFDEAISLLKKALARVPYNLEANTMLGEIYSQNENSSAAIPPLRIVLKERPGDARSRVHLARALANLNRVTEAILILEAATEDPDGSIHFVLSDLYRRQGRTADAASALQFFQNRRNAAK
jgi:tetratricopeptide (TPR) repeat protein